MITEEEYKQWKPLIEEYEQYEFQQQENFPSLKVNERYFWTICVGCKHCKYESPYHADDCPYKQEED